MKKQLSVTSFAKRCITKPCTQLHSGSSTSTQHYPAPSNSTQLISNSNQLHPPPPSSFQPPPSFLQHPKQYSNQNIARNWAISPNLSRKIQSSPFSLKIRSHGILEVLIPNPDLNIWNSDPKIHFWANLGPKRQSCQFCLKINTHGISSMLILVLTLIFLNSDPKIHFWPNLGPKTSKLYILSTSWHTWYLKDANSYSNISSLNFQPYNLILGKISPKKSKWFVLSKN